MNGYPVILVDPPWGVTYYDALRRLCYYECGKESLPSAGLDLVIFGGESGKRARPCHLEWAQSIVEQCRAAGVAMFVKQLGAHPVIGRAPIRFHDRKGGDMDEWPVDLRVRQFPGDTFEERT